MFSLFRADSVLSQLNRPGRMAGAPPEFTTLLHTALEMAAQVRRVCSTPRCNRCGSCTLITLLWLAQPGAVCCAVALALSAVDWRAVQLGRRYRHLARPGMALTLNGVAQGFITDRCTDVLRAHGFDRMLVDMGEPRALAAKPDGSAWRIGLADPREPSRAVHTLPVIDRAVATSGGYGTRLDGPGRYTHLINPQRATQHRRLRASRVIAPSATQADACQPRWR
jgi:thiamine biosynthesis lipoprotein